MVEQITIGRCKIQDNCMVSVALKLDWKPGLLEYLDK